MGLYDRDYTQYNYRPQYSGTSSFPSLTPIVKILIMINIAVFILDHLTGRMISQHCALINYKMSMAWQVWRFVTFQFLHATPGHIIMNMIGLYFLGTHFERKWGAEKFLAFYLSCGVVGGIFFFLFKLIGLIGSGFLVGASGGVLGLLAAAAILSPQFVVFIFIFPVPIRIAAVVIGVGYLLNVISGGHNAGGDAAHLGGMAAGAIYCYWPRIKTSKAWQSFKGNSQDFTRPASHIKMHEKNTVDQAELDRILKKIHEQGIHTLTQSERDKLRQATKSEQERSVF